MKPAAVVNHSTLEGVVHFYDHKNIWPQHEPFKKALSNDPFSKASLVQNDSFRHRY